MKRERLGTRLGGLVLAMLVAAPLGAPAVTIPVDATADDLGDGPNGNCTLREAVIAASTDVGVDGCPAGNGADVVQLAAGTYRLTRAGAGEDAGATGDLDPAGDVTIAGAGAAATIVDAGGSSGLGDRVIHVQPGARVTVRDLTIAGGYLATYPVSRGGGILDDGGTLLVANAIVRDNTVVGALSQSVSGSAVGGGVASIGGATRIQATTIRGNHAPGVYVTYVGGSAAGAGLHNDAGSLEVADSVIRSNDMCCLQNSWYLASGAAFYNEAGGVMSVERTAILENGSFANPSGFNRGELHVRDSSFARNHAGTDSLMHAGGCGGLGNAGGTLTLEAVTMWGTDPGSGFHPPCSVESFSAGTVAFRSTVVDLPCQPYQSSQFVSLGRNLGVGQGSFPGGQGCGFADPTDVLGAAATFTLIEDGTVPFLRPEPGNPAIDTGDPSGCTVSDQRGVPRPADGNGDTLASCDRGAVEVECPGPDGDGDGDPDDCDVCPGLADPGQADADGDRRGDACDLCPAHADPVQEDSDADGLGNGCDNCAYVTNADQADSDGDGAGDACDPCVDMDHDGYSLPNPACDESDSDCDDANAAVHPNATEIPGNGLDDDCNPATPGACVGPQLAAASAGAAPAGSARAPLETLIVAVAVYVTTRARRRARACAPGTMRA